MVTFEGRWSGGRVPLSVLPMKQPFALSAEDTRLLDTAEELAGGETPGGLMLVPGRIDPTARGAGGSSARGAGARATAHGFERDGVARAGGSDARNLRRNPAEPARRTSSRRR